MRKLLHRMDLGKARMQEREARLRGAGPAGPPEKAWVDAPSSPGSLGPRAVWVAGSARPAPSYPSTPGPVQRARRGRCGSPPKRPQPGRSGPRSWLSCGSPSTSPGPPLQLVSKRCPSPAWVCPVRTPRSLSRRHLNPVSQSGDGPGKTGMPPPGVPETGLLPGLESGLRTGSWDGNAHLVAANLPPAHHAAPGPRRQPRTEGAGFSVTESRAVPRRLFTAFRRGLAVTTG